jgi:hypothetical protein
VRSACKIPLVGDGAYTMKELSIKEIKTTEMRNTGMIPHNPQGVTASYTCTKTAHSTK